MRSKDKKGKRELPELVIVNPEAIPRAQERFTKIAYESYMQALREGRIKQIEE